METTTVLMYIVFILKITSVNMDFNENLKTLTEDVIKIYFKEFKCIIYITDDMSRYQMSRKFDHSIVIVNININLKEEREKLLKDIHDMNCKGFIIQTKNRENLVEELIFAFKQSQVNRYNNQKYLFLPVSERDDNRSFLEMKEMYYMPDLVFVAPKRNSSAFEILSHNYFDGQKYDKENKKFEVVNEWNFEGFHANKSLYPNKMKNLKGKEIILALMQYAPYTLVINNGTEMIYDGLEVRIAAEFVYLKNATWKGLDHPEFLWGDIFDNGTGNGILGSIYGHKADIGFAAIYQWHCDILECSYPYIQAGVTCLVPRSLPLSGWYTIILPFEPGVWVVILFTYLFSSIFVFSVSVIVNKRNGERVTKQIALKTLTESFFKTFRTQIEQSPKESNEDTPLASFFKSWTIYCFFVAVCWQGGIASFLTVPRYEDAINDVYDLVGRWPVVEWGANHIDWTKSIEQSTDPVLMKIVKDFRVIDDATLKARVKKRNFGYFMERLPNGHYGMSDYIDEEGIKYLQIMGNNIYMAACVMVLPKCSPYLESLDKMLIWMFDTGLIQKLEIQVSLERINNRLQNMVRTSAEKDDGGDKALLMSHIQGAIFIYLFGMCFSSLVFILEVFIHKKRFTIVK